MKLICLLFISNVNLLCVHSKIILKANSELSFDNKYEITGNIGNYIEIENLFWCFQKCIENTKCVSFFFNKNQQKCILHPNSLWNKTPSKSGFGWKFYNTQDASGRCPSSNGLTYNRYLDLCYKIHDTVQMNYNGIVKPTCFSDGLELVRIDSAEKNSYVLEVTDFVAQYSSGLHICIQGTNSISGNLAWTFEDGSPMTYFNWDKTYSIPQPDNKVSESMIAIARPAGTWHDFNGNINYLCLFLCEKR
ncbi:unnamed protein product [Mytilus edulis]|uniref:Apple domain-containing protein n=1 Tax=Mytilus edulis TaxID=6550 RepID=A0A8S3SKH4_MYTED|nr:unnamed protein product [Mytilus edulis]